MVRKKHAGGSKKTPAAPTPVETVKHKDSRTNIPTREPGALVADDEAAGAGAGAGGAGAGVRNCFRVPVPASRPGDRDVERMADEAGGVEGLGDRLVEHGQIEPEGPRGDRAALAVDGGE